MKHPSSPEPWVALLGIVLGFVPLIFVGCDNPMSPNPDHLEFECSELDPVEVRLADESRLRCIEAGGKGPRSTEDWVAECRSAFPSVCKKELVVVMNSAGNFAHVPCRVAGLTTGAAMCAAAGWRAPVTSGVYDCTLPPGDRDK